MGLTTPKSVSPMAVRRLSHQHCTATGRTERAGSSSSASSVFNKLGNQYCHRAQAKQHREPCTTAQGLCWQLSPAPKPPGRPLEMQGPALLLLLPPSRAAGHRSLLTARRAAWILPMETSAAEFLTWCGAGAEHGGTGRAAHELQTGCSAPKTCRKSSLQRSRTARPGRGRQGAPGGDKAGGWRVSVLSTTCSSSAGETCQHQLLCSSVPWGCLTAAKRKKKKLPGFGYP